MAARIEATAAIRFVKCKRLLAIPHDNMNVPFPDQIDSLARFGTVGDDISGANNPLAGNAKTDGARLHCARGGEVAIGTTENQKFLVYCSKIFHLRTSPCPVKH